MWDNSPPLTNFRIVYHWSKCPDRVFLCMVSGFCFFSFFLFWFKVGFIPLFVFIDISMEIIHSYKYVYGKERTLFLFYFFILFILLIF